MGAGHRRVPPRLRAGRRHAAPGVPARPAQARDRARAQRSATRPSSPPSSSSSSSRRRRTRSTRRASATSSRCRPGMFGYSWVREGQNADLCHAILDDMERFGIPIEGLHTETGPGVYEVAIRYDEALRAADKAALFKTAMKQVAARLGYSVTFMAKWNAGAARARAGTFTSRCGRTATNVFYDAGAPDKLSARRAPLPRRAGRADARADGAHLAHRQQLQALRARACGRRSPRAGASRTAPAPSAPSPGARRRRGSSTGRRRRTSTRTSRWRRPSRRGSRASSTASSRRRRSRATRRRGPTSRRLPRTLREATRALDAEHARARDPGRRASSITTSHARLGVPPVRARRDRVGARALLRERVNAC